MALRLTQKDIDLLAQIEDWAILEDLGGVRMGPEYYRLKAMRAAGLLESRRRQLYVGDKRGKCEFRILEAGVDAIEAWQAKPIPSCEWCKNALTEKQVKAKNRFCCYACSEAQRLSITSPTMAACTFCAKEFEVQTALERRKVRNGLEIYCSDKCLAAQRTKLKHERWSPNKLAKALAKEEAIANGTYVWADGSPRGVLTEPHRLLMQALGWPKEVGVRTYAPRVCSKCEGTGEGYPSHYYIDLAREDLKLGVEIDGVHHAKPFQKILDAKKEECLHGLGWTILRVTDDEILADVEGCADRVRAVAAGMSAVAVAA